jgi:putative glycosyltransferase
MGMNVEKLKLSLNNGTFFPVVIHALRNRWPFWWIRSKAIREVQLEDRAYRILKRKYDSLISNSCDKSYLSEGIPKQIWICWFQGMENAPELVKSCFKSVKREFPDYQITVLTAENIQKYVTIPEVILYKWNEGIINNANFSDVLRVWILAKHGGVWLDATVYCTGNAIKDLIEKNPFFMYKSLSSIEERISSSSWMIASTANHPLILSVKKLLVEYWCKENVAIHYFVFHLLFTIVVEHYPDIWKSVPTYSNADPHIMVDELNNDFSVERYRQLCQISDFHKLNYKKVYNTKSESLYSYLLNQ